MAILSKVASDAGLLPGKFTNIKAVYLKTHDSVALPVYAAPNLTSEEERLIDDDAHKGAKAKKALGMKKEKTASVKSLLADAPDVEKKGKKTSKVEQQITDAQKKSTKKKKRADVEEEEEGDEKAGTPSQENVDEDDVPMKKTKKKLKRGVDDEKPSTGVKKKVTTTTKRKLRA